MLPPLAVAASVEIAAWSLIRRLRAVTLIDPASPLAASRTKATIPLPTPLTVSAPCALRSTVPPCPEPEVAELICAPLDNDSAPTDTKIDPPLPVVEVSARIPLCWLAPDP